MPQLIPSLSSVLLAASLAAPLTLWTGPAQAAPRARPRRAGAHPASSASIPLHPVELPDGSGTMQLPPGWHITGANNGMVDAVGPQGMVDLGLWCTVYTPQFGSAYGIRPPLVASYGDPARAVQELMPQFAATSRRLGQPGVRWIRLIEQTPAPWPQGKAAFLHYEVEMDGRGRWQTIAFVAMTPNPGGNWTYYTSMVSAPSAQFARSLPALLQVWSHWKVADHIFQQRLANALASMRETNRILHDANAYREEAGERSAHAGDLTVRGHWVYEDTETGEQHEVDNSDIDKRVAAMNHAAGYERYKIVPYHKLHP